MRGALLALLLVAVPATAAGPPVSVSEGRIRLLPGDLPVAGYMDVANGGDGAVTLTGASSPAFGRVRMHRTTATGMEHVGRLVIRPGTTLSFAPGALHLMMTGRTRPLAVGDTVPVILEFGADGTVTAPFQVRAADTR